MKSTVTKGISRWTQLTFLFFSDQIWFKSSYIAHFVRWFLLKTLVSFATLTPFQVGPEQMNISRAPFTSFAPLTSFYLI